VQTLPPEVKEELPRFIRIPGRVPGSDALKRPGYDVSAILSEFVKILHIDGPMIDPGLEAISSDPDELNARAIALARTANHQRTLNSQFTDLVKAAKPSGKPLMDGERAVLSALVNKGLRYKASGKPGLPERFIPVANDPIRGGKKTVSIQMSESRLQRTNVGISKAIEIQPIARTQNGLITDVELTSLRSGNHLAARRARGGVLPTEQDLNGVWRISGSTERLTRVGQEYPFMYITDNSGSSVGAQFYSKDEAGTLSWSFLSVRNPVFAPRAARDEQVVRLRGEADLISSGVRGWQMPEGQHRGELSREAYFLDPEGGKVLLTGAEAQTANAYSLWSGGLLSILDWYLDFDVSLPLSAREYRFKNATGRQIASIDPTRLRVRFFEDAPLERDSVTEQYARALLSYYDAIAPREVTEAVLRTFLVGTPIMRDQNLYMIVDRAPKDDEQVVHWMAVLGWIAQATTQMKNSSVAQIFGTTRTWSTKVSRNVAAGYWLPPMFVPHAVILKNFGLTSKNIPVKGVDPLAIVNLTAVLSIPLRGDVLTGALRNGVEEREAVIKNMYDFAGVDTLPERKDALSPRLIGTMSAGYVLRDGDPTKLGAFDTFLSMIPAKDGVTIPVEKSARVANCASFCVSLEERHRAISQETFLVVMTSLHVFYSVRSRSDKYRVYVMPKPAGNSTYFNDTRKLTIYPNRKVDSRGYSISAETQPRASVRRAVYEKGT